MKYDESFSTFNVSSNYHEYLKEKHMKNGLFNGNEYHEQNTKNQ